MTVARGLSQMLGQLRAGLEKRIDPDFFPTTQGLRRNAQHDPRRYRLVDRGAPDLRFGLPKALHPAKRGLPYGEATTIPIRTWKHCAGERPLGASRQESA